MINHMTLLVYTSSMHADNLCSINCTLNEQLIEHIMGTDLAMAHIESNIDKECSFDIGADPSTLHKLLLTLSMSI